MPFLPLITEQELNSDGLKAIRIGNERLLVIRHAGRLHVVANRCGHFGVPLDDGVVRDGAIYCSRHGIGFDLNTGAIVNRPWERCDPLRIFAMEVIDGMIGIQVEPGELDLPSG